MVEYKGKKFSRRNAMKTFYKFISILLCLVMVLSLSACGGLSSIIIYFEVSNAPDTLDPQLASADEELLIVRNIFEGLLRQNEKGEIVSGVAESYKKDGLTYTFNLKKDAVWSDGTPLTADDFVFAFKRAVDKKNKAPFVKRLFAIKNAEKIYNGKTNISSLGVKAINDTTLQITLEKNDKNFEKTLTTSICMPCNEEFFNSCKGQYGLKNSYIISNGSYSITKWNREDFGIRIYRNRKYNGDFIAQNGAVFFSSEKDQTAAERLLTHKADIAFIDNADIKKFDNKEFSTVTHQNICWVLNIGNGFNSNLRSAFAMITDPSVYETKLKDGFSPAYSIYPSNLSLGDGYDKIGKAQYNKQKAFNLFSAEVVKFDDKKLPKTTLIYYENEAMKPVITSAVGHWQQTLSAFINISPATNKEYMINELKNPTAQMSVFPIKATSGYIEEYLDKFGIEYSGQNLATVQKNILKSNKVIPLAFENTNIVYSEYLSNVHSNGENGYIDFSIIIKED